MAEAHICSAQSATIEPWKSIMLRPHTAQLLAVLKGVSVVKAIDKLVLAIVDAFVLSDLNSRRSKGGG